MRRAALAWRRCCAWMLGVMAALPVWALDLDRSLAQFHHTAWTARDGAPSQIGALAQTADGYLWVGSARGLFRFDGVHFERLQPQPGVSLPSFNVYALSPARDGGLWIAFRPSGLGHWKDERLQVLAGEQIPAGITFTLVEDTAGRLWAGTDKGLSRRVGVHWVDVGPEADLPRERVWSLLATREGGLWVATVGGLFALQPGADRFRRVDGTDGAAVHKMVEAADGSIWVANEARQRLYRYDATTLAATPLGNGALDGRELKNFLFDRNGALWATTIDSGLRRIRSPGQLASPGPVAVEAFQEADGLTSDSGGHLIEDREGNVWVSTLRGLSRFRHSHLVPVKMPTGAQSLQLVADAERGLWVGGAGTRGVVRIDDPVRLGREPARVLPGSPGEMGSVYAGDLATSGSLWWGGAGAVWRQRGQSFERLPAPPSIGVQWAWEVMASGGDGLVWVGYGDQGVWRVAADGQWQRAQKPEGMLERSPSASFVSPTGERWFGYTANRAAVLAAGRLHSFDAKDGLAVGRIRVIRGRGETVWLGGETGLAMFAGGRFYSVAAAGAPPFGTVCGIVEARSGDLWLNELQGVVRIPAAELRALRADPTHAVAHERFDYLDGLPGGTQMNWCASSAVEAADGHLWFATDHGIAWITPGPLKRNAVPPPVHIRSLLVDGQALKPASGLALPAGAEDLRISFTALSLSIPERVQFKYRLEGYDTDWRSAGARRDASYTRLPPGRYTFRVQASNNDGVWNEAGASVDFVLPPTFVQSRAFVALCLLAGLLLVGGLVWARLRQVTDRLRERLEARMTERERIARELHDTLLQGVTGLTLHVRAAASQVAPDSPVRARLEHALTRANEVMVEGRERVGALRRVQTDTDELEARLRHAAEELAAQWGGSTKHALMVTGTPRPLQAAVADEAYWIVREALANAFKHAQARNITLRIHFGPKSLELEVGDDGTGFDTAAPRPTGHFGLTGLQERATRIEARLELHSDAAGTAVRLTVPAALVYAGA